jgi:uncharacterized C2H2 Zn-finger protein
MTCPRCDSIRIITENAIQCPKCDSIELGDLPKYIIQINKEVQQSVSELEKTLKNYNYNSVFQKILFLRESAAQALLSKPDDVKAANIWVTMSFL